MRELQSLYESILAVKLDKRNFRKKFFAMDFLVDLREMESDVNHRPGKLYKFDFRKYEQNKQKWAGV
jgi:8-oxo-dGTP diphosphatase